MARALRWASARAGGVIVISRAVGRDARSVLRRLPIDVVYNAVDTDYFLPRPGDGRRLDALAGLPVPEPETLRVGLVATYARWKGQDLFLEAARIRSERSGQKLRFYIIGGPIYRTPGSQFSASELRARAAELGITQQVGFIGFQQDTAEVYRALDIAVHASTQPEPFGRTIVEAMACGKPVIVSRAGGAAELFTDNEDTLGVPPGDAEALASSICALADDPDRRRRLAGQARRTANTVTTVTSRPFTVS
jgi:glycosyltransferase involved in cell wall biosynthesis